jgi:hypothetical protein
MKVKVKIEVFFILAFIPLHLFKKKHSNRFIYVGVCGIKSVGVKGTYLPSTKN